MDQKKPKPVCSGLCAQTLCGVALALVIGRFTNFFPFWLLIPDLTLCTILYAMTVTCAAVALCVSAAANELNRRMQRELDSIREEFRQAGEVQRPGKEEESNESSEEGSARNTQAEQA